MVCHTFVKLMIFPPFQLKHCPEVKNGNGRPIEYLKSIFHHTIWPLIFQLMPSSAPVGNFMGNLAELALLSLFRQPDLTGHDL